MVPNTIGSAGGAVIRAGGSWGAISASSSADVAAHGASMAADGSSSTFWVSEVCVDLQLFLAVYVGFPLLLGQLHVILILIKDQNQIVT